jgi:hypothetical protein
MGRHYSDLAAQAEGEPCAWLFGVVSRFSLLRTVTNWMGDDAVLRRFCWRHMTRTRVGDAMIGRATVVGKRVEDGEHLADLHVWLRNLRGNVSEAAVATVGLPSRDAAVGAIAAAPQATHAVGAAAPAVGAEPLRSGTVAPPQAPGPAGAPRAVAPPPVPGPAAGFQVGDRVRLKPRPDWPAPPGFRFAGAEGTVGKWVQYDEAMADFQDVVACVRIDQAQGEAKPYIGGSLLFPPGDLELVSR